MTDTNLTALKKRIGGDIALDIGGTDAVDQLSDIAVSWTKAADDSLAADATANTKVWTNPFDFPLEVMGLKYSAGGTITAHDTNYATLSAKTDNAAAGSPVAALDMATKITAGTGDIAAEISKAHTTRTAANCTVPVGGNLFVAIAKAGTGVVVRAGVVTVRLKRK